ncbi:MAG TPA: efflux RND transporter permease subunit [Chthoniobacterales bacterium]|nr:efflux RND transporter permease subunit [Chthoniobacterales bacterium]
MRFPIEHEHDLVEASPGLLICGPMHFSEIFIRRPVATTLLTIGVAFAGLLALLHLSVAPLPQVDFPTVMIQASMSGASPDVMAATVAAPLERHLGFIADVTEMTSRSSLGQTQITLQFALDRDIDGAARDVEAAINAARADLPSNLRSNPTYRKYNPSDAPILLVALTSATRTAGQLYDTAATVLQQKLSQIEGVGNVDVGGSSLPAVRVELNPDALSQYGIGLEDVRAALAAANANSPKGAVDVGDRQFQVYTNDQATHAADYRNLVIAYRNNRATLLSDVAQVNDSVQSLRYAGSINGKPAVTLVVYKQPGANVIQTVDRIKAILPFLKASLPGGTDMVITGDRTATIRTSLADTEQTLVIAIVLVILVVLLFLGDTRAMLIPGVMVPISIIGTFSAMYLLGYSLNNLSLMALTIATGFVVDDAVVVLENIARHMEVGRSRFQATLVGTREVAFTVFSISLSLIGVFLPILLMGGIIGRFFREFTMTLSVAVMISLVLSLTATPMMCSKLLRRHRVERTNWFSRVSEGFFKWMLGFYEVTLRWSLKHSLLILLILIASTVLNFHLFNVVPKNFFPDQDAGILIGGIQADSAISFQLMRKKMEEIQTIVQNDPAVDSVVANTGGRQTNSGNVWVTLKPLQERDPVGVVATRLRAKLVGVSGARLFLFPMQDIRVGGRISLSQYQYTLQADDTGELLAWTPKLLTALRERPELTDLNSDQQQNGLQADIKFDRLTMRRFGLLPSTIDNTLYDAFGERQVSTIYNAMNQYSVVMEVAPQYWQSPDTLKKLYVSTQGQNAPGTESTNAVVGTFSGGSSPSTSSSSGTSTSRSTSSSVNQATNSLAVGGKSNASSGAAVTTSVESMVPLAAFAHYEFDHAPLSVNHQGLFVASTISFNLAPGYSLSDAVVAFQQAIGKIHMPASIHGTFGGTANAFQSSLKDEPILILAALIAVYVILGILYESYVHPITILSTLPSATLGALIALILFNMEFSIISMLGMILLIGIVKKNAILMVDFALQAEREELLSSQDAICKACLVRFRPIMMTTFAAILGAFPLVIASGYGSELRRPLGVSIIGGLVISQILTLYTTPVIYLYLDRLRLWFENLRHSARRRQPA